MSIDKNLLILANARRAVARSERETGNPLQSVERFYHLTILECADMLSESQFEAAIKTAQSRLSEVR